MTSAIYRDREILEYFGAFKSLLSSGTSSHASLASIEEDVFAINQILEETAKKEHVIAVNQKCSKLLEKALYRLCNGVISTLVNEDNAADAIRSIDLFISVCKSIIARAKQLSTSTYSSHVLQTLFSVLLIIYSILGEEQEEKRKELEVLPQLYLDELQNSSGHLMDVICNPCGSHVIRSFLLTCGGYVVSPAEESLGHRNSKARKSARNEELPSVCKDTSQHFSECVLEVTAAIRNSLEDDPLNVLLHAYASPALEILLLILKDKSYTRELNGLISSMLSLENDKASAPTMVRGNEPATEQPRKLLTIISTLAESPIGSRILEKVFECVSSDAFYTIFSQWFICNVNILAVGRISNFVVQSCLASPQFSETHLKQFINAIDLKSCIERGYPAILWKCAECCRRLQACYRLFVKSLLQSLQILNSKQYGLIWPSLLLMECLLTPRNEESAVSSPSESSKVEIEWSKKRVHPSGCSLIYCLLKFPPEHIQSLLSSFSIFVKRLKKLKLEGSSGQIFLKNFGMDRQGSRLLQCITSIDSPIPNSLIKSFIKCFEGTYGTLSVHPVGGFVITSFYKAASVNIKKMILGELLPIRDEVKAKNFAVYKLCDINQYAKDLEAWQSAQTKKSKTRELFGDIIIAQTDIKSNAASMTSHPKSTSESTHLSQLDKGEIAESEEAASGALPAANKAKKLRSRRSEQIQPSADELQPEKIEDADQNLTAVMNCIRKIKPAKKAKNK